MPFKNVSERLAVVLRRRWKTPMWRRESACVPLCGYSSDLGGNQVPFLPLLPEIELQPEQKLFNEKPQTETLLIDAASICLQGGRPGFNPWVGKIPWRRKWQPTPVFLPGESHGRRSLVGYSPWVRKESDTTEWLPFSLSTWSTFGHGICNPLLSEFRVKSCKSRACPRESERERERDWEGDGERQREAEGALGCPCGHEGCPEPCAVHLGGPVFVTGSTPCPWPRDKGAGRREGPEEAKVGLQRGTQPEISYTPLPKRWGKLWLSWRLDSQWSLGPAQCRGV